jgi:hypothetical protein
MKSQNWGLFLPTSPEAPPGPRIRSDGSGCAATARTFPAICRPTPMARSLSHEARSASRCGSSKGRRRRGWLGSRCSGARGGMSAWLRVLGMANVAPGTPQLAQAL